MVQEQESMGAIRNGSRANGACLGMRRTGKRARFLILKRTRRWRVGEGTKGREIIRVVAAEEVLMEQP